MLLLQLRLFDRLRLLMRAESLVLSKESLIMGLLVRMSQLSIGRIFI
jgi:hypothetical protein